MWFRMLGPLEVITDGRQLSLGGSKQRATLGYLLLHPNQTVSISRLLNALWSVEEAPATARKILQNAVWGLRRALDTGVATETPVALRTQAPGYCLDVTPDHIDLHLFHRWANEGRSKLAAGEPDAAAPLLSDALELWRGPALADLTEAGLLWPELTTLQNTRLDVLEDFFEAQLACGRHYAVLGELESMVETEPLRERACAQLIRALYRCGRQADALGVFSRLRTLLVEDLGLEPSRELQQLQQAILTHDPDLQLASAPDRPLAHLRTPSPSLAEVPALPHDPTGLPNDRLRALTQLPVQGSGLSPNRPVPAAAVLSPATGSGPEADATTRQTPARALPAAAVADGTAATSAVRRRASLLLVRVELESTDTDCDQYDATLSRVGAFVRNEIECHDGVIAASLGTVTLAYFPADPIGNEHLLRAALAADTLRAVMTARHSATAADPKTGRAVLRAAVATGNVMFSQPPGGGLPPEVNGALLAECWSLLALANSSDIVVCDRTRQEIEKHCLHEKIPGTPTRWKLLKVIEPRLVADDVAETGQDDSSHRRELDLLQSVMTHSSRWSQPHLITVLGNLDEPRRQVLQELEGIATEELAAAQVLTWNSGNAAESCPFGLHRMILSAYSGLSESDPPWTVRSKISTTIQRLITDKSRANWIAARCASLFEAANRPKAWLGAREWMDVWRHFLEAVAQDGPIVLIIDELHLADTATIELVDLMAQLPGRIPLTVIVGGDPELLCQLDWSPEKRFSTVVMLEKPSNSDSDAARPSEVLSLGRNTA